jgi:hypothetical protein
LPINRRETEIIKALEKHTTSAKNHNTHSQIPLNQQQKTTEAKNQILNTPETSSNHSEQHRNEKG